MCNYDKSKIYKITDMNTGNVYIGSTTSSLSRRKQQHIQDYRGFMSHYCGDGSMAYRNYRASADILINDNWKMELIKNCPCKNRKELNIIEDKVLQEYIDKGFNVVNKIRASKFNI